MKGRDQGKGHPSTDLLVCFPTRAHLTLMPKRICSPSRPSEINTHRLTRHHTRKFSNLGGGGGGGGGGHASPLLWAKTNDNKNNCNNSSEPTSPKVTCAGQIKVRAKPASCKNWQSVMEEIERIHNKGKQKKKKATWMDAIGLKKDVMNFLTCLRHIRFDFRCFGSFPAAGDDVTSEDEEDEDDDHEDTNKEESNGDVFSKWFMILQQENNQVSTEFKPHDERESKSTVVIDDEDDDDGPGGPPPPANALLLMRCRSAPAKSWLEEKEEEEEEEKKNEKKENLVVMKYGADLSKISCDIAKETWVVGGIKDLLSRSRSSKR